MVANLCAGLLSRVVAGSEWVSGTTWLGLGVTVFSGLTVLNLVAARRFDPQWNRQSVGLFVFYECVAAGSALWWAVRGL